MCRIGVDILHFLRIMDEPSGDIVDALRFLRDVEHTRRANRSA
jgi:hypothetical protein